MPMIRHEARVEQLIRKTSARLRRPGAEPTEEALRAFDRVWRMLGTGRG
jgi:hypothetical protein